MIDFIRVSKRFGVQDVLSQASFRIHAGERVGVVGSNGSGKSTVFGLIAGELSPDEGEITVPKGARLGHLHQQLRAHAQPGSLLDYASKALVELPAITEAIRRIEKALPTTVDAAEQARLLRQLGDLQHEFEHVGGYDIKPRAEAALSGLGFNEADFGLPFRSFSGGWQMRAELVRTLVARPDILLLDEPSNYLDLPAIEWLQRFLRGFDGTLLLISHDRYLLEHLTTRTLEIGGGAAVKVPGGYAYYTREREQRLRRQWAAHRAYEERKAHLEAFIHRFRAQATKAAQVQSRVKMLEKLEAAPAPTASANLSRLRIPPPPHSGAHAMTLRNVGFTYDTRRWILRGVNLDIRRGEKMALVGFNGMGKTTLLRILAGALRPQEGVRQEGHRVVLGYQSQDFAETMPPSESLISIIQAANPSASERDIRALLGSFGFAGDAVHKTSGILSGGEKIRLAFARIFVNPPNLLLLDEPTTNLDIHGREALEIAVREYKGSVCFVSHDVSFVRGVAEHIVAIGPSGVSRYPGGYDDYLAKIAADSTGPATPASAASASGSGTRGRDLRRKRAREREAGQALRAMEREMETLHDEQRTLCNRLAGKDPSLDHAALNIRLAELTRTLTALETRWLEEADRLHAGG